MGQSKMHYHTVDFQFNVRNTRFVSWHLESRLEEVCH